MVNIRDYFCHFQIYLVFHVSVQGMAMPQPSMPATVKPQMHKRALQSEDTIEAVQPKSRVPVLEKYLVDQLSKEEQSALNTKFQEASDADQKVYLLIMSLFSFRT